MGLLGSQVGGSPPNGLDSAFGPLAPPDGLLPLVWEEPLDGGVEEMGGDLAERVTVVPSRMRRRACCTPSPPTSRPPPQVPNSFPPRRANLSTSSMWTIPTLFGQHCTAGSNSLSTCYVILGSLQQPKDAALNVLADVCLLAWPPVIGELDNTHIQPGCRLSRRTRRMEHRGHAQVSWPSMSCQFRWGHCLVSRRTNNLRLTQ